MFWDAKFMRTELSPEHLTVGTLAELDALIGERVMGASPQVYWEDSYANQRFNSLEEALAAMRDPYFQLFIPENARAEAVLAEVREFPAYSSKIATALEVVERYSADGESLLLRQKNHYWIAAFGEHSECRASTAATAICLAALRARGIAVSLPESVGAGPPKR
jgi:hypothetical protein